MLFCVLPVGLCYDVCLSHLNKEYRTYLLTRFNAKDEVTHVTHWRGIVYWRLLMNIAVLNMTAYDIYQSKLKLECALRGVQIRAAALHRNPNTNPDRWT